MQKILFLAAAGLLTFSALGSAEAGQLPDPGSTIWSKQTVQKTGERRALIADWIALAENAKDGQEKTGQECQAIRLLGEYRAKEAIPVLLKKITYMPDLGRVVTTEAVSRESLYPCVRALINIGAPSDLEGQIFKLLLSSSNLQEKKLAAFVLREVYGPEDSVSRLSRFAEKLPPDEKKRINECVRYLKNWTPDFPSPQRHTP